MPINDFLLPNYEQIRNSIRDIDDSYTNDWDILAELCQNSVDAIRLSPELEGKIQILIDAPRRTISVIDNGVGIEPKDLPNLIKPFSTNKKSDSATIGEKGVGLTYAMFSGNYFEIVSGTKNGSSKGIVRNAYTWKISSDDRAIPLEFQEISERIIGTRVTIREIVDSNIFNLNLNQLLFVIRTKTALGNTLGIWDEITPIDIEIVFIDNSGREFQKKIPNRYWLISEKLQSNEIICLDDFVDFIQETDRTDSDKRKKLKDKLIFKTGSYVNPSDNRVIKYYACFVPNRNVWNKITVTEEIMTSEQVENDEYLENFGYAKFLSGTTLSVKGMPTGIYVDHPTTGFAGYWSNLFILFEDHEIKFDIGRKSIQGKQATIYKKYSKVIFNDFVKYVSKYVAGDILPDEQWERDDIFAEVESIVPLGNNKIKFEKCPKDQEASVAAIFYECIGKNIITGITPIISGYKNRYDLYVRIGNKRRIVEFKSKLRNVIRDFSDQRKMFDQLDCIVCWCVDDEDRQVLSDVAIDIVRLVPNTFNEGETHFPNATHKLEYSGFVKPVYVIDLSIILA